MSVTFTVHPLPEATHVEISTWCNRPTVAVAPEHAQAVADEHTDSCAECAAYDGPLLTALYPFDEVNLANGNAGEVLSLLGYDGEDLYIGTADAEDLLGRLLLAEALLAESAARPYREQRQSGQPTMVDLGRPAGYVNQRISQLADLASWAAANRREIVWS
jgi:hypothetical protein